MNHIRIIWTKLFALTIDLFSKLSATSGLRPLLFKQSFTHSSSCDATKHEKNRIYKYQQFWNCGLNCFNQFSYQFSYQFKTKYQLCAAYDCGNQKNSLHFYCVVSLFFERNMMLFISLSLDFITTFQANFSFVLVCQFETFKTHG